MVEGTVAAHLPFSIRAGSTADLSIAVALWDEAQSARRGMPSVSAEMLAMESRRLSAANALFFVLEEDGKPIGIALASPAREDAGDGKMIPRLAHISSVAIKPGYWGRGLGRRLMNALIQELPKRHYTAAQLWTQPSNLRALQLYLSLGFKFAGDEKIHQFENIRRYLRTHL
ncbi:MAG: GNAT family N-acetyltransferase [Candidatus Eremiobacteraeota bacterium]|nr:GNAT family N-acetyltransferase [Candidatus Eremiobacteraeota bacterium]